MTRDEIAQACQSRRYHSCGRIDVKLGWTDHVPDEFCEQCLALGPHTNQAHNLRALRMRDVIDRVKAQGIEYAMPVVQLSIMGRFMTREEATLAKLRIDAYNAEKERQRAARKWDGEPMPSRLVRATKNAGRAFVQTLKNCPGCGCFKPLKRALTGKA